MMIVLINDILDLAKVDAGKMTFENKPFKLAETISSMLDLFELRLQEKDIELIRNYDSLIPEVLSGDPLRLQQVILNLMSNAIKFTSKGKITITVRMLNEDEATVSVEFSIADTGVGISEEKLHLIFDNFEQAHDDDSNLFGGTGLGLSIVKKLLEAQGGSIEAKSKLNVGSVFTFTLAFKKTNKKQTPVEDEKFEVEAVGNTIKVLVVEDISLNQLLMKTLLADFGFQYEIFDNGKAAIEKLAEDLKDATVNYDVILMDLQMPEMNGYEAASYIRYTLHLDIPIIALTADVTTEAIQKCISAGMNDYISKPVDEKLLFTKIIDLLKIPPAPEETVLPGKSEPGTFATNLTDLNYLKLRTKYDSLLIKDMIRIYLDQTPPLIEAMKKSMAHKDWEMLRAAAHKLFPSFAIMGIPRDFQNFTKIIQEYTGNEGELDTISELIAKIESACKGVYAELNEELTLMNNSTDLLKNTNNV